MKTVFIYALCEPGTRTVRYIGMTGSPKARLRRHLSKSKDQSNHRECWLFSLISRNTKPEMVILREVPKSDWKVAEERYIRLARGCGMNLTNGTDGGDGRLENSPGTLRKITENCARGERHYMFGKTGPAHHLFGKPSPLRGVPRTEETRKKLSEGKVGDKNPCYGKRYTEEERLALSITGKRGIKKPGASSKFFGVCWQKGRGSAGKWAATLCARGKHTYLGLHENELDAARAHDKAAYEHFGASATLNFPVI